MIKKGFVIGIIILFVGASITTSIGSNVKNDCLKCGASAKKIEKALNSGEDYKKPSRESVLERMRKAGLPTRI